jgi:hypothetical protein
MAKPNRDQPHRGDLDPEMDDVRDETPARTGEDIRGVGEREEDEFEESEDDEEEDESDELER